MAEYFMGIDLGTSSVRAFITDFASGQSFVAAQNYDVSIPQPGYAEQDADMWFDRTVVAIRDVLNDSGVDPRRIVALSFSGQMHGMVALDEANHPVMKVPVWLDQRSTAAVEELRNSIGEETMSTQLQNRISAGFLLSSLYWLMTCRPELYRRVARVILPKDYIKYRLCGRVLTDPSDAAGSLAFDNVQLRWADSVIAALGIEPSLFPECLPSTAVVGHVSGEAARLTGLWEGTLVVNGGGDQCMQSIGNGVVEEGVFASSIGTSALVSVPVRRPLYDPALRTNFFAHVIPGCWSILVACLNGGNALKWFSQKILGGTDYGEINRRVAQRPAGTNGLLFLPYLAGERTPYNDAKARGIFFGLTLDHDRWDMARALMEGVLFGMKAGLEIVNELGVKCEHIVAAGGGARSDVWLQMQADIFEREIWRSASREQACLGAAITAAVGTGRFTDFAQACASCVKPPSKIFSPIAENVRVYRESYPRFLELYAANKPGFDALN